MARVQCAGCGTIISDDGEPGGTYGCCAECNKHTFRSNEQGGPCLPKEYTPTAEETLASLESQGLTLPAGMPREDALAAVRQVQGENLVDEVEKVS